MSMQTAATRTEKRHRLMAYPDRCRPPGRTGACAAFSKIQSEEFRKIAGRQNFPGISSFPCERKLSAGAADEFLFVQLVKPKEELGLAVEAGGQRAEHRGGPAAHKNQHPQAPRQHEITLCWEETNALLLYN